MSDRKWNRASVRELTSTAETIGQLLKRMKLEGQNVRIAEMFLQGVRDSIRSADYEIGKEYLLKATRELKNLDEAKRRAREAP